MAWIILDGLDRSGKSTIANLYKNRGYEVIHLSAPDKRYLEPGYTGPSYVDEMLDLYLRCTGKDVVFDRSIYGEFVWPQVYGRAALIKDEDLDAFQEIEAQNMTQHILMYDSDVLAHWQRCEDFNEPLTKEQFKKAVALFDNVATTYGFGRKQLKDFGIYPETPKKEEQEVKSERAAKAEQAVSVLQEAETQEEPAYMSPQAKLAKANAINEVLGKRILKKSGKEYDVLEDDIRGFLKDKLSIILGDKEEKRFTEEEIDILKLYCAQIKKRAGEKK
jgi:hypothetical protein